MLGSGSRSSSKSATIEMYVGTGGSGPGSYSLGDAMSGAGETLSSLSEKSDSYFTSEHHRHDLEVECETMRHVAKTDINLIDEECFPLCRLSPKRSNLGNKSTICRVFFFSIFIPWFNAPEPLINKERCNCQWWWYWLPNWLIPRDTNNRTGEPCSCSLLTTATLEIPAAWTWLWWLIQ